jgi:hypothetical protein
LAAFRVSVVAIKANALQAEEFFPSSEWDRGQSGSNLIWGYFRVAGKSEAAGATVATVLAIE